MIDRWLRFLFLGLNLIHFAVADDLAHICGDRNYTTNSTFHSNLNLLLASLSSTSSTFFNDTKGSVPADLAYGLVLCRGDVTPSDCGTCIKNAAQDILSVCPKFKKATVWYDYCLLRYADIDFLSVVDSNGFYISDIVQNVTDTNTFIQWEKILMETLSFQAAYTSSLLFATGRLLITSDLSIYGLAQCTRDLSEAECSDCLQNIFIHYLETTNGHHGGRVLSNSCNMRYEGYPFYQGNPSDFSITLPQQHTPLPSQTSPPNFSTASPQSPSSSPSKGNKNISGGGKVLKIVTPTAAATVLILILLFICFWRRRSARKFSRKEKLQELSAVESLLFDISIVKSATANFSEVNKLGQGGFGSVYKGILPDGQEIAVKRLSTNSRQGIEELKNELVLVAKLQHKNLVRLHGVCLDEEEKLLVYEYVPNRSLDTFLFDTVKRKKLNWETRFKIIRGIAQGLFYLHEECHLKVIHRDLKASNILLDTDMNPKISDFGLSRLFGGEETQCTTNRVVGTFGYMAPEYAMRGQFSVKSDIYSYGVLVLEIVTGRKRNSFHDYEHYDDLLSYTWEHWTNGRTLKIIDPLCCDVQANEVLTCIRIGLLCTQEVPAERPLMSLILRMLNSSSVALPDPSQPRFCAEMDKLVLCSTSEASYSELEPR